jgi:hypothetical protein
MDPLVFYPIHSNDSNSIAITTNGIRSRNGTTIHERSNSVINDSEHHTIDSTSTIMNTNSSTISLSNSDEKENRRIIDIQCKIKTKETGSSLVRNNRFYSNRSDISLLYLVIDQCKISRSITT